MYDTNKLLLPLLIITVASHLMKTMEKLVLNHLPVVSKVMDPLQFANIMADDAVSYLLHWALTHLHGDHQKCCESHVFLTSQALLTPFSRHYLLQGKLEGAGLGGRLTPWTMKYLIISPQ